MCSGWLIMKNNLFNFDSNVGIYIQIYKNHFTLWHINNIIYFNVINMNNLSHVKIHLLYQYYSDECIYLK